MFLSGNGPCFSFIACNEESEDSLDDLAVNPNVGILNCDLNTGVACITGTASEEYMFHCYVWQLAMLVLLLHIIGFDGREQPKVALCISPSGLSSLWTF
jgi:hypothetical protein